jgi:hypothetical protein
MLLTLSQDLRKTILSVLEDTPSEEQVTRLVRVCHALACPFVASKCYQAPPALLPGGLTASDIAYDCIGDLFRRDERGTLIQVRAYFAAIEISEANDTELLMHLRRLVFSSVNQGMYRLYKQMDPGFAKILRNVKLAVATLKNFIEVERFGEPHIVPAMVDPLFHCPPFEASVLERELSPLVTGSQSVPSLLAALSLVLRQQREFSRSVALTTVTSVFRSIYARGQADEQSTVNPHDSIMQEQVRQAIHRAAQEAVNRVLPAYSKEPGWSAEYAVAYQHVVEQNLALRLLESDGVDFSYYAGMHAKLPALTKEEYRATHKNRVEYVGRLAYEILVSEIKKEFKD